MTYAAQTIEIEVQKNVSYSISIDDAGKDWITHTGTKGLTSEKTTFSIAANETYDNREAKITFKQTDGSLSETVVVKQNQTDGLFLTTPDYNLSNGNHTLSVEVKSNVSFEVTSEAEWIKYVETKALNSSTVTLMVDANETYDARTGKVTIKQTNGSLVGEIIVNQAEKYGLFVSPEEVSVTKDAQMVEVEVQYNVDYDIVIPDVAKDWVSIKTKQSTKGLKTGSVSFAIEENTNYFSRETAIAFKQKDGDLTGTVRVIQAQTDYLNVTPQKDSIEYSGGSVILSVIANVEYEMLLDDTYSWITIEEKRELGTNDNLTAYEYLVSASENEEVIDRYAIIHVRSIASEKEVIIIISQGPQPFIEFKDPNAKKACLDNFDINKDGFLTYKEAASVTEIGQAFRGYSFSSFDEFQHFTSITSITEGTPFGGVEFLTIPGNCKNLEHGCFMNSNLKKVVIMEGTDVIGPLAFANCNNLNTIVIPESVTKIHYQAFAGCTSLESFTFPQDLISLGSEVLRGCTSLKTLNLPSSCIVADPDGAYFSGCTSLETVIIPEGWSGTGKSCFNYCISLKTVSLPSSMTGIGDYAFRECYSLESIIIPENVSYIGRLAFGGCTGLETVYLKPLTPPSIIKERFKRSFEETDCLFYVPSSSYELYKSEWGYSTRIRASDSY